MQGEGEHCSCRAASRWLAPFSCMWSPALCIRPMYLLGLQGDAFMSVQHHLIKGTEYLVT